MPTTSHRLLTANEFLKLGEGTRELVRGEIVEMTPAGGEHGEIGFELGFAIGGHAKAHGLGKVYNSDTGFLIERNPDTVRCPDVSFVSKARVTDTKSFIPLAPDLAVEVVSPEDRYSDVAAKIDEWLAAGTREVWIVDPRREQVAIHRSDGTVRHLGRDDALDGGTILPGFHCPIASFLPKSALPRSAASRRTEPKRRRPPAR